MRIYARKHDVNVNQIVIAESSTGFISRRRYISTSQKVNYEFGYDSLLTFKLSEIKRSKSNI
jgi:hypothetical protein